ncbi:MAG: MFS transporter [Lachnospiraceae bacterium]|nr:MFS transporter [Lachnospiraceae bacterium]
MKKKDGAQLWFMVWALGLAGQLCWNMENQWFNTFVYARIAKDPTIISWMVAISAAATTFSTFLFGCISDRIGKRKILISVGYILWGIFTIVFGLTQYLMPGSPGVVLTGVAAAVVAADAVMSFFGSMGNDIGFNAWINDHMNDNNRGQLGAALATQPVIGTIAGTVVGGMLVGADNQYMRLFLVMGGLVIALGVLSLFLAQDAPGLSPSVKGSFSHQFFSIFDVPAYLKHRELVWVNLTLTVYFIAFNVYFVHLGNYMIYYLGFSADMMGYIEGLGLAAAMLVTLPAIRLLNAGRAPLLTAVSVILNSVGLLLMGLLIRPDRVNPDSLWNPLLIAGVLLVGLGYILFLQTITVWSKQLYPEDARGQFEGIRILFFVLIPMVAAPLISNPIIKRSGEFVDENGFTAYLPTNTLFLVSGFLVLLTFIPLYFASQARKQAK